MEHKELTRKERDQNRKEVVISVRVTLAQSKFMADNDYSPTLIFQKALKDLGCQ